MDVKFLGIHFCHDLGLFLKRADNQPHFCRKPCAIGEMLLSECRQKFADPLMQNLFHRTGDLRREIANQAEEK